MRLIFSESDFYSCFELEKYRNYLELLTRYFFLIQRTHNTYTVVVATAKNIESLMDKERMNYFEPGYPFIIVKKLTKEIISEAIEAYALDEAYWLKLYHFAGKIDTAVFNQLRAEHMEYLKELDELDNS